MTAESLKLMCILAHPDDESLGTGGILARYAAEGIETHLITATRGEHGWFGAEDAYPGPKALGALREAELRTAADVLGIHSVSFLGYIDGELDQADPAEIISQLAAHLRRVRPQVVVTFDPNGAYGHPDHVAICQFTTAALVAAADSGYPAPGSAHRVSKLYYLADPETTLLTYQQAFGELVMTIDGQERRATSWPDWAITTRIDTSAHWEQVWQAVQCHQSQLPGYEGLRKLPEAIHRQLWGEQSYYRALSLVNGGRAVESDLFEGLRPAQANRSRSLAAN